MEELPRKNHCISDLNKSQLVHVCFLLAYFWWKLKGKAEVVPCIDIQK